VAEDEAAEPGVQAPNKGVPTLSITEKVRIVGMHEKGISNRAIGQAMGRSDGAVARAIKAWEQNERSWSEPQGVAGSARPPLLMTEPS
jgi:IS30 family transposase